MADILNTVLAQISPDVVSQISRQVGADQASTEQAIQMAAPILISALARNTQSPEGAASLSNALTRDHDGGLLGNLAGAVLGAQNGPGAAILGRILGGRRQQTEQVIEKNTGVDAGKLLVILAPIILAVLGRMQRQQQLSPDQVAGQLRQEQDSIVQREGDLMGTLNSLLDQDKDGTALDDVADMFGRFFGNRSR